MPLSATARAPAEAPLGAPRALDILYAGTLPPHTGGSALLCGDLLPALARRGHRVRAIAPIAEGRQDEGAAWAEAHREVSVERVAMPRDEDSPDLPAPAGYRAREHALVAAALSAQIARRRPDVVVAGRETFAWHVPDVARSAALPCAILFHGGASWGMLRGTLPSEEAAGLAAQIRRFDLRIVVARHLAAAIAKLQLGPTIVIENTVDADRFRPRDRPAALLRELGLAPDDIVVAHVSNLKPLKRTGDLVLAARAALPREPRLRFVVVGDGATRAAMEAQCAQLGIAGRFRFTGWVPRSAIPDHLALADLVAMTSEVEARALVYMEAQACARTLVASDIASAREVIADGETGLLYARGDVDALAATVLRAAADPALRERIGRAARQAALARPFARMVDEYEAALGSLAGAAVVAES